METKQTATKNFQCSVCGSEIETEGMPGQCWECGVEEDSAVDDGCMETKQSTERITVYETGQSLVASWGLWNSPRDGHRARPQYWATVPSELIGSIPALYAGEWIDLGADCLPEFSKQLKARFDEADKLTRPWAY